MLTATCRVFRRPQRPKDDAVVRCQGRYRRLSGPLRFPRYHVHPERRQSLLARVPGLSRCLLVLLGIPTTAVDRMANERNYVSSEMDITQCVQFVLPKYEANMRHAIGQQT